MEPNEHHPTSWKLSISSDGQIYTILDEKVQDGSFNQLGQSVLFDCEKPSKGTHIKLTMTEKSTVSPDPNKKDQGWWFHLSRVEFFGRIYLQEGDDFCPVHSVFIRCPCSILFTAFIGFIGK